MLRKTLIAIAAAGTMAMGIVGTASTAEARHRHGHIGIWIGVPHVYHRSNWHCHYKKVKVWNKRHTKKIWVTKKTYCHSAWHHY